MSRAAFGLGTLALFVPFFVPGIPGYELLLAYLAGGVGLMIALMLWGIIREGREVWRQRRRRK